MESCTKPGSQQKGHPVLHPWHPTAEFVPLVTQWILTYPQPCLVISGRVYKGDGGEDREGSFMKKKEEEKEEGHKFMTLGKV